MSRRTAVDTGTNNRRDGGTSESTPLLSSPLLNSSSSHANADESHPLISKPSSSHNPSAVKMLEAFSTTLAWLLCGCCGRQNWAKRRISGYLTAEDDLNIYSFASLAIVMSYFSVGVALELLSTPVAYYLIDDLGAESGVYTVWVVLVALPWSFKVMK